MPFTHARDLDIYYELAGEGPRLLYISGTGGDLRSKPNHMDGPLTQRFTVLAYDQRGLGQTSKPDAPYTMADYGDDAAALMDALGWDGAMVMGVKGAPGDEPGTWSLDPQQTSGRSALRQV